MRMDLRDTVNDRPRRQMRITKPVTGSLGLGNTSPGSAEQLHPMNTINLLASRKAWMPNEVGAAVTASAALVVASVSQNGFVTGAHSGLSKRWNSRILSGREIDNGPGGALC